MLQIESRIAWRLAALTLAVTLGVVLNPYISNPPQMSDPVGDGILVMFGCAGLVCCMCAVVRRWQRTDLLPGISLDDSTQNADDGRGELATPFIDKRVGWYGLVFVAAVLLVLWLLLFRERLLAPTLFKDDFEFVRTATSWQSTRENLLKPFNGHVVLIPRFTTWLICSVLPADAVPAALSGFVLILFVTTWPLIFLLVYREWLSAALGVLTVCLFAMTRSHQEIVLWFSAGIHLVNLDLLLISLLALQGLAERGGGWRLCVSGLCSCLAPFCYSSGLVIGPLSAVYLANSPNRHPMRARFWVRVAVPLVGTASSAIFLSLWLGLHEHAAAALRNPMVSVLYGVRVTVDVLLLGNVGLSAQHTWPRWVYAAVFLLSVCAVIELLRRVRHARWAILGVSLIIVPSMLILTFRTWLLYDAFRVRTRHQLFAQLGLAILVAGTVGEFWPRLRGQRALRIRHVAILVIVATLLFLLHARRSAYVGG